MASTAARPAAASPLPPASERWCSSHDEGPQRQHRHPSEDYSGDHEDEEGSAIEGGSPPPDAAAASLLRFVLPAASQIASTVPADVRTTSARARRGHDSVFVNRTDLQPELFHYAQPATDDPELLRARSEQKLAQQRRAREALECGRSVAEILRERRGLVLGQYQQQMEQKQEAVGALGGRGPTSTFAIEDQRDHAELSNHVEADENEVDVDGPVRERGTKRARVDAEAAKKNKRRNEDVDLRGASEADLRARNPDFFAETAQFGSAAAMKPQKAAGRKGKGKNDVPNEPTGHQELEAAANDSIAAFISGNGKVASGPGPGGAAQNDPFAAQQPPQSGPGGAVTQQMSIVSGALSQDRGGESVEAPPVEHHASEGIAAAGANIFGSAFGTGGDAGGNDAGAGSSSADEDIEIEMAGVSGDICAFVEATQPTVQVDSGDVWPETEGPGLSGVSTYHAL
eukprot:g6342.t1